MNNVNRTLYIPLYGKAYVSQKGVIFRDDKAEEIWAAEGFSLKGKSKSKWLAYYMGMRSAVFDRWVESRMKEKPAGVVLHIGCGMDSRCLRVTVGENPWFDLDFPEVIRERRRYYRESDRYRMLSGDIRSDEWLEQVPGGHGIVVMEGVSMYLSPEELVRVMDRLAEHFDTFDLLVDCYTEFAAKASSVRNPINDVGVTQVYGLDDPKNLEISGVSFLKELEMTPEDLVGQLRGMERKIFRTLYGGAIARKMYRLYAYRK